ncbi:unnamed protein product [Owenia fusiformis]|uniref:Copper transport protein n=1 Tax=Owenia fusiformis TaxID=6347 RepID=A0A8J1TZ11_OWEFU|nr:unnamed protein product [Owenia fusiformis]
MDHSMMNHSMPGHNMMNMSTPDPHAGHGHHMGSTTTMDPHAGHNMGSTMDPHAGHGGHGGMKMYFHFSPEATILFYGWKTTTTGGMVGSCIGIFFMAMMYEGLKVFREYLLRKGTNNPRSKKAYALNSSTDPVVDHEYVTLQQPKLFSLVHIVQTLLHIIQITVSYFLMLIFMTYNVWLCIAVALGAGAGYFVFGWKRAVVVDMNEHCH